MLEGKDNVKKRTIIEFPNDKIADSFTEMMENDIIPRNILERCNRRSERSFYELIGSKMQKIDCEIITLDEEFIDEITLEHMKLHDRINKPAIQEDLSEISEYLRREALKDDYESEIPETKELKSMGQPPKESVGSPMQVTSIPAETRTIQSYSKLENKEQKLNDRLT